MYSKRIRSALIEKSRRDRFSDLSIEDTERTVKIKLSIYEKLAEQAREEDNSLRGYINDQLATRTIKYEISKKLRPSLTLLATEGNSLFIRDSKAEKVAEVKLTEDTLRCLLDDESEDCVHVAFVWGLFELGLLNKLAIYGLSS